MKVIEFKDWLSSGSVRKIKSAKTVQSRISNCKKVEKSNINLDTEYSNDYGKRLLTMLNYSMDDLKSNRQPTHNIQINGDIYTNTSTYRQSVKLYFMFCDYLHRTVVVSEHIKQEIQRVESNISLTEDEKRVLVKYRVGQSEFRKRLINYWEECSVTDCDFHDVLIASHIKPWSISNDLERYDIFNGLLLTPNYDKLFDRNLISFDDDGLIMISDQLSANNLKELNISTKARIKNDKLTNDHIEYLRVHRNLLK